MKVIFLKDVGGVGKRDEVKEIADGFALNSLIPQGKAIQATPERIGQLQKKRAEDQQKKTASESERSAKVAALRGREVRILARANDQGHLFKSVTPKDIVEGLAKLGLFIEAEEIVSPLGVKALGTYSLVLQINKATEQLSLVIEKAKA